MLNSRFELSKIERKNESFSIKLSKIKSRKRIFSFHSRKSRVEREFFVATLEKKEKWKISNFRDRERNFSFYSRFFSRERDSCQCLLHMRFCLSLCKISNLAPEGYNGNRVSPMNTHMIKKTLPRKFLALLTACRHIAI